MRPIMAGKTPQAVTPGDEPPPVFRSWGRLYAAVVAYLFFLITLFYLFTVSFNGGR
ncbi:MAG: hypothetical protein HY236_12605 [Acidobacteria bacterium]|nr:hypothetical protein [Acidobacteriota bacterium]